MAVFDIEANALNATRLHVLSYEHSGSVHSIRDYDQMTEWLMAEDVLIGHNIQRYDIPTLERLLGIKIRARLIDTLALSWYLFPDRLTHGLEDWGVEFGVPKPEVDDWENLDYEIYRVRCEEDVKINTLLWNKIKEHLSILYDCHPDDAINLPIVHYLEFKMDCAREKERSKWKVDVDLANRTIETLRGIVEARTEALARVMPPVAKYVSKTRPAKPYKKDGSWSTHGANWFNLLKEHNLPEDYDGEVKVVAKMEPPNPASSPQVKDWLFSLGWEPITFKWVNNDDGTTRQIPQIRVEGDEGKELCPSVKALADIEPGILELEGLTVAQHRLAILEGFLENMDEEQCVQAQISGLTNTLRFKHKTVVNLPGVLKPFGKEVRGCLIARDGNELCGSDMSSLEDLTKRHYMFKYDPEYVKEMSVPGFDPHLNLALFAKALTEEDVDLFKSENKKKKIDPEYVISGNILGVINFVAGYRKKFKVVNYSATYGVGAPKLSREMKVTVAEAKFLLDAYWKRNWAIRKIAEDSKVKRVRGQDWIFNPVSKFWYSLRFEKDRFSTLNQSTGVYCFDSWVREVRKIRPQLTATFHDEIVLEVKKGHREQCAALLQSALDRVNKRLNLNVTLGIDIQFGDAYSDIH